MQRLCEATVKSIAIWSNGQTCGLQRGVAIEDAFVESRQGREAGALAGREANAAVASLQAAYGGFAVSPSLAHLVVPQRCVFRDPCFVMKALPISQVAVGK
jgi:hypothetical protein